MRVPLPIRGAFAAGCLGPFEGFLDPGADRVAPYFTRGIAHRIACAYRALPCLDGEPARQALYDRTSDAFRFLDCVGDAWMTWCGVRIQEVTLYPIGSPEWTWEFVGVRA